MEKKFDVVTALDCCVDLLLQMGGAKPEFGQKEVLIEGYQIELGGSACIFASQCAKLGLRTAGAGTVGEDAFGRIVLEKLQQTGVDISLVRTDPAARTGIGVALNLPDGDRGILTYSGTIDMVREEDLEALIGQARHLHIASYFLIEGLRPHWPRLLERAKKLGATVSLDTNWDPSEHWGNGLQEILPFADVVLVNEQEALAISGRSSAAEAAAWFLERVGTLVVKRGERGAAAWAAGRTAELPGEARTVADTVGAGDSFDGGFLYGWLEKKTLEECLALGSFCAGRTLGMAGGVAGQPLSADITIL